MADTLRDPGRPRAQPPQRLPRAAPRQAHRVHRAVGLGQVVAGLRHHLRRGPAPLRRVAVVLRPPVPRPDGQARRRLHRGPVAGHLDRPEVAPRATPARRSAPSPRSTTTCGCCSPASACPTAPSDGAVVTRQTPQQIVDRILELPEGTRFQVLAPVVRGRKGTYETLLADLAAQGFARARVDGELHELTDKVELARYEQHTIEVVVDRLVRREGIERRLTDSLETALQLADGVAEVAARAATDGDDGAPTRAETLDLQPAPGLPDVRRQLRGAGAPQLLVQLALRRLRALRRPRHPVRGRPRAGRARPRPQRSTRAPSPRGPAATAQYFQRLLEAVGEELRHRHRRAVGDAHRPSSRRLLLYGTGVEQGAGPVQEPLRPRAAPTTPTTRA